MKLSIALPRRISVSSTDLPGNQPENHIPFYRYFSIRIKSGEIIFFDSLGSRRIKGQSTWKLEFSEKSVF